MLRAMSTTGPFAFAQGQPVAHAIFLLAIVAVAGLALGSIKYRGVALGVAGVIFAGILIGHFGQRIDHATLDFVKEFGLVLFVFTIGMQLGPGFVAALHKQGLRVHLLAMTIVLGGTTVAVAGAAILRIDYAAAVGLLSGATTNTPSLGAAQQALTTLPGISADRRVLPALAYAVAYPAGVAGIIGSLLALRWLFGIDPAQEAEAFAAEQRGNVEPLERANLVVENPRLDNLPLGQVPGHLETGVVVSRVRAGGNGETRVATGRTTLHTGDVLLTVGTRHGLEQFARIVGRTCEQDLMKSDGPATTRRVVVTNRAVLGKSLRELALGSHHGVTVTRISRGDLEMTAAADLKLRFGDVLQVVGTSGDIAAVAPLLGDSAKELNETQFIPLFLGIALGVIVGGIPIWIPGVSMPVRLGLAGGPLIAGIVLSRVGHVGGLVWHMTPTVNLAFRELGITLFLAAVGLTAGERFFETVWTRTGLLWFLCAAAITMVPLVLVGSLARYLFKMNYATLSGLIAGSMTDPPALAFAGQLMQSDGPQVSYATVYPLTMMLRIVVAQVLVLWLCG
jgi:putative transport protein